MADESRILGYVLEAPGRPGLDQQRLAMDALGVDTGELGTLWHDKIGRGSTRPRNQLEARNDLLLAVQEGDTVIVAAPFCLGLSAKDAEWFLGELTSRGVTVVVSGEVARIEPGGQTDDIVRRVSAAHNAHHVRVNRAKK